MIISLLLQQDNYTNSIDIFEQIRAKAKNMKMPNHKITICVLIGMLLLSQVSGDTFYYQRLLTCVNLQSNGCLNWNETSQLVQQLSYSFLYYYFCFSEDTYVLSREGPVSMKDLKVGDEIWALNSSSGQNQFSPVQAWLHRDTQASVDFESIHTNQGISFLVSDYHNVAFHDTDGKISFKFANNLREGDQLVSFGTEDIVVSGADEIKNKIGLYSPFTSDANFYIYQEDYDPTKEGTNSPLILVHSLSQIQNVYQNTQTAEWVIEAFSALGLNKQPEDDESYVHPLISNLKFLFGSDWVEVKKTVAHPVHYYHSSSYSSTYQQQQQKETQFQAMTIALGMLQQIILYDN